MRVLLPLKKKQDDPEQPNVEESYLDQQEGALLVVVESQSPASVEAAAAADVGLEESWTHEAAASPTAVLLSAAAARLSCLQQQQQQPPSSPSSSSESSFHLEDKNDQLVAKLEAGLNRGEEGEDNPNCPSHTAQRQATEKALLAKPQATAEVLKTEVDDNTTSSVTKKAELILPPAGSGTLAFSSAVTAPISSVAASVLATTVAAPSTPTATPATSTRAARKRRASSPIDQKQPPSKKKARDNNSIGSSKKPAATTKLAAPTTEQALTTTNTTEKMAGGRGGRKIWTPPSYYVETTGGRGEDVSNGDEGAEVDVRFTYRHENDPSSARGDGPTGAVTSGSAASTNTTTTSASSSSISTTARAKTTTAAAPRKNTSNSNNNHQHEEVCGRDDDDEVRERCDSNARRPEADNDDDDAKFAIALKKQGLEIVEQEGDGNCLFRAISLQVYGDASMHGEVRHRCLDFMARDKEHFSQFITDEPFEQYIRRKRQDGVHGNNPEIQAISELFNRPIEVFVPENGASPLNIFHAEYKTQDAPIRLSYHDGNHYNAVIDPLVPTAGLGLGLPGLQPGLADKMQVAKAVAESDRLADQREYERALEESQNDQLQRAIKESTLSVDHMYQSKALSLSDADATNFELEQAVLESSLESFRTFEHGRKQASKANSAKGRRKRQASPPQKSNVAAGGFATSSVASIPREARQDAGSGIPSAASAASASPLVASAPAVASRPSNDEYRASQAAAAGPMMAEHYPQTVQELVMNGFELRKVVHAYELVGDNFDDLLGFLMSNSGS